MGRPHVQSFHWVAHGHVSIHAHHSQGEHTGEHVIVVDGDDRLAQGIAKGPETKEHICALEGKRSQNQRISQCQVKYIDVGSCLHLGISGKVTEKETTINNKQENENINQDEQPNTFILIKSVFVRKQISCRSPGPSATMPLKWHFTSNPFSFLMVCWQILLFYLKTRTCDPHCGNAPRFINNYKYEYSTAMTMNKKQEWFGWQLFYDVWERLITVAVLYQQSCHSPQLSPPLRISQTKKWWIENSFTGSLIDRRSDQL